MVVKIVLTLLLGVGILFANPKSVDYHIIALLGVQDYKINQKFIQRLFKNQSEFMDGDGNPNVYKISQVLKQNGLLKLVFASPMELEISFEIAGNPMAFTSALYDILGTMGYYYFLVKQSALDDKSYKFILSMDTEYAIDPVLLQERLREYGYMALKIEKQSLGQWVYEIKEEKFQYPKAVLLNPNEKREQANLSGEYWYRVSQANTLGIASSNGILWYPKIVFFDSSLRVLEIFSQEVKAVQEIKIKIPKDTAFIKISDIYLPLTIKNGLVVELN
ncbi:hypothetical protein [Helicobacter mesocricetorum]|uniref:hypothetical protein n=1 Tax=Helicobacter mesocricetorum TaxID=87012 RepID=UPI000CF01FAF|nr:hypothetical protein [Helicobacter mesocricetorum]